MGKHAGNIKQRHIDHPRYRSNLICIIHGNGHSSENYKVLNDFGTRYATSRTYKELRHETSASKR